MNEKAVFPASAATPRIAEDFARLLFQELACRRRQRLDDSYLQLKYVPGFFSARGVLNHLAIHAYAARLSPLLAEIRRRPSPRLLDAGAGCGSEAILAALSGAHVTGIDLVPFRTAYAGSRVPFFQEVGQCRLPLRFLTANAITHLRETPGYDLIWVNEAISHIHPAEAFLAAAYQGLLPGGLLIISDANALNPVARWRAARIRGGRKWYVHRQCALLDDTPHDEVAEERLFSCRSLPRLLRENGFRVRRIEMHGFLGSFFLPPSWQAKPRLARALSGIQQGITRIPLVRDFGSSMTVIAEKSGGS